MENITFLVSSADSYSDCWYPFFELLIQNWSEFKLPIILNTETLKYEHPNLEIFCPVPELIEKRKLNWGERLTYVLEEIKTDYILWILDDYFIRDKVNHNELNNIFEFMKFNKISHISLMDQPGPNYEQDLFSIVKRGTNNDYLISLQASLWEKSFLHKIIRKDETPWELEKYGSQRARFLNNPLYSLNPKFINSNGYIFNYQYNYNAPILNTGAIRHGKWILEIPTFLDNVKIKHNIDFRQRGFYDPVVKYNLVKRIKSKLTVRLIKVRIRARIEFIISNVILKFSKLKNYLGE